MSLKMIAGVGLPMIGAIATGLWAADARWARAADVEGLSRSITAQTNALVRQVEIGRLSGEAGILELRRAAVMDKIQDGKAKGGQSAAERAILDRYERDREFVERQLRDRQKQIDQLRAQ